MTALPKHEPRPNFVGNSNAAPKLAWWTVLQIQPSGQMQKLVDRLEARGVTAFYPAHMRSRYTGRYIAGGKREKVWKPTPDISGYVFARFDEGQDFERLALDINLNFRPMLMPNGRPGVTPHTRQMEALWQRRIQVCGQEQPEPEQIKVGDVVEFDLNGVTFQHTVQRMEGRFAALDLHLFGREVMKDVASLSKVVG